MSRRSNGNADCMVAMFFLGLFLGGVLHFLVR